jgi:hypothetical protein
MITAVEAAISDAACRPCRRRAKQEMYKEAAAGKGVIASENFALLHHVRLGDVLTLLPMEF